MASAQSMWAKIGRFIRPDSKDASLPRLDWIDVAAPSRPSSNADRNTGQARPSLIPWRRRDQTLDNIRNGYDKVLGLVESIQKHLAEQNRRSAQAVESLSCLAGEMTDISKAAQQQAGSLNGLVCQLSTTDHHIQVMADAAQKWPEISRDHKQAMSAVADELGQFGAVTTTLSARLEALDRSVCALGELSTQQVKALQRVQEASQAQVDGMSAWISNQTKRLMVLAALVVASGVIAAAVAFSSVVR